MNQNSGAMILIREVCVLSGLCVKDLVLRLVLLGSAEDPQEVDLMGCSLVFGAVPLGKVEKSISLPPLFSASWFKL